MPAVMIRQLDTLTLLMGTVTMIEHREVILDQAQMIMRGCTESVPEEHDRADVTRRYESLLSVASGRFGQEDSPAAEMS